MEVPAYLTGSKQQEKRSVTHQLQAFMRDGKRPTHPTKFDVI